jgi:hypothetical protein
MQTMWVRQLRQSKVQWRSFRQLLDTAVEEESKEPEAVLGSGERRYCDTPLRFDSG